MFSSSQSSSPHSLLLLMTTPTSGPHGQQLAILGCYNLTPCDPYISFSGLQHSLSGFEGLLNALPMMSFCQTSSVFSDPLDLLDHPLLLDIFFLGAPQLRAGVGFLFFYKVSFEKHPSARALTLQGAFPFHYPLAKSRKCAKLK